MGGIYNTVKVLLKALLPTSMWSLLLRTKIRLFEISFEQMLDRMQLDEMVPIFNAHGVNVSLISDFYSPLPVVSTLKKNLHRWFKPSEMVGVGYDLEAMKARLLYLLSSYGDEYRLLPCYDETKKRGYGPGYTALDAMILYFMVRDIRPRRYIEIGSGLSTWYCSVAAERNARLGNSVAITCVDPYPFEKLYTISGVEVVKKEVQDVEVTFFEQLNAGDILFIDSTHVVKIDGDVSYVYLEVLPRLKKGVVIQIHDIHFPFNVPYPAQWCIFGGWKWPVFWTEAMLLQAFLCNNDAFSIRMSAPLLRYFSEDFLKGAIPNYTPLDVANTDTHFGSLWIEKVR